MVHGILLKLLHTRLSRLLTLSVFSESLWVTCLWSLCDTTAVKWCYMELSLYTSYSNCISVGNIISTQQMVALRSATDNLNSEHHIFLNVYTLTCTHCTNRNKQPNLNVQGFKQAAGNWKLWAAFSRRESKSLKVCVYFPVCRWVCPLLWSMLLFFSGELAVTLRAMVQWWQPPAPPHHQKKKKSLRPCLQPMKV